MFENPIKKRKHLSSVLNAPTSSDVIFNVCLAILFALLVSVTIIIRIRMLGMPLDRDVGEYAYAGQLMLEGVPPYSLAYNMKMPGIYAAYAVILAIFGQGSSGIHLAIIFINTATIILLFFITKKLFGPIAGVAAGVFFAITSISNLVQVTANAENFVVLFALAGILFLMSFTDKRKIAFLITAGLLMGMAFMMKQHGAGFMLFGLFYLLCKYLSNRPIVWKEIVRVIFIYSFFSVLPFLVTCLILWRCGVFEKFWFWTFEYARHYVSLNTAAMGYGCLRETLVRIVPSTWSFWLTALLGLLSIIWNKEIRRNGMFITGFLFFSILSVCPGLYFRPHYFMLLLPAVCVLAGVFVVAVRDLLKSRVKTISKATFISITVILFVWIQNFYTHRNYLFETNADYLSRLNFGNLPFAELVKVADFIKANSNKDDKVVVFGSEPQIYFYSHRRSGTGFIYTYPLMERQPLANQMQKEMINQIEASKPRFIIVMKTVDSWMPLVDSEKLIFDWSVEYLPKHYRQIGLVEMFYKERQPTLYRWDSVAKPTKDMGWIMITERID